MDFLDNLLGFLLLQNKCNGYKLTSCRKYFHLVVLQVDFSANLQLCTHWDAESRNPLEVNVARLA